MEGLLDIEIPHVCGTAKIKSNFCMIKSDRKRFSGPTQNVLLFYLT